MVELADGTLIFETKLDTKGLQTGLKSVDDKLKGLQKTATLGLGAIASGLIAAGTAGVKFNAQMEQYTATFETFTGSAEEATATMDKLLELGAKTPFETEDLANATQLLMSYGLSAEEAVGSLTMLGDASAGNAEKLQSIATGFARMKSTGKVTLEYLNLMIENGFNPLNQVAEDTGMTMAEVYDAISAGEITFEQINDAMVKMTSEGGQYFGLMEKQSQTLNGRLSTLSDTVNIKLGEAFQVVSDKITELLPNVIEFVENIDVTQATNSIIALAGALGSVLTVVTAIRGVIKLFNIITFIQSAGGLATIISTIGASIGTVLATVTPVIGVILAIVAGVVALIATIKNLWETNETFRQLVLDTWNSISETLNKVWLEIIEPIFTTFMGILNWIITYILPILLELWNATFVGIATYLSGIWEGIMKPIFDGMIGALGGLIDFLLGIFTADWKRAWKGLVDFLGSIFQTIVGVVKAPLNALIALINSAINAINSISFTIPDWVPFIGGQTFAPNLPTIPYLAKGGVLKRGQVGLLEGSGAEAVVPLEKNKAWISAVAKDFAQIMPSVANTNQTVNFYQTVETPDEMARALRMQQRYGLAG